MMILLARRHIQGMLARQYSDTSETDLWSIAMNFSDRPMVQMMYVLWWLRGSSED